MADSPNLAQSSRSYLLRQISNGLVEQKMSYRTLAALAERFSAANRGNDYSRPDRKGRVSPLADMRGLLRSNHSWPRPRGRARCRPRRNHGSGPLPAAGQQQPVQTAALRRKRDQDLKAQQSWNHTAVRAKALPQQRRD